MKRMRYRFRVLIYDNGMLTSHSDWHTHSYAQMALFRARSYGHTAKLIALDTASGYAAGASGPAFAAQGDAR